VFGKDEPFVESFWAVLCWKPIATPLTWMSSLDEMNYERGGTTGASQAPSEILGTSFRVPVKRSVFGLPNLSSPVPPFTLAVGFR